MTKLFILFSTVFISLSSKSQSLLGDSTSVYNRYNRAYTFLTQHLIENGKFSSALFEVENFFYQDDLDTNDVKDALLSLIALCKLHYISKTSMSGYNSFDKENYAKNYAIFSVFSDTTFLLTDTLYYYFHPFSYSFASQGDSKHFKAGSIGKLLITHKGNCRSLTYLYKILADELGAKCWLSLAPNHIYIRNYNEKIGWYNTELTSGTFPTDAWIAASGYVSTDAIRSGIYMDTLSNQQAIALCVLDLAKGYEFQTRNYYDGFILKCCDLVLQYHPVNPMALLLKAKTLQKVYEKQKSENDSAVQDSYRQMEDTYIHLVKLGYREMPEKMYNQWLKSITSQQGYLNKKVTTDKKALK